VQYLVSGANDSKDFEFWLRFKAAGTPVVIAHLDNNDGDTNRIKRELTAEKNPRIAEHIKEYCAFEEEVLNARGENEGNCFYSRFSVPRTRSELFMIIRMAAPLLKAGGGVLMG